MGYIKHDAILIVLDSYREDAAKAINQFVAALPGEYRRFFVGPVEGTNGELSYVVLPDTSKEGWPPSNAMDEYREQLMNLLEQYPYGIDALQITFGGDYKGYDILPFALPKET